MTRDLELDFDSDDDYEPCAVTALALERAHRRFERALAGRRFQDITRVEARMLNARPRALRPEPRDEAAPAEPALAETQEPAPDPFTPPPHLDLADLLPELPAMLRPKLRET